jgi:tetratricopeptide (TPR) repeat protein
VACAIGLAIRGRHAVPAPDPSNEGGTSARQVELSGCAGIVGESTCELPDDGALRVWVSGRTATSFVVSGKTIDAASSLNVGGGTLHRVMVPGEASELRVSADGNVVRVIRLTKRTTPAWLAEATAARRRGDTEAAANLARTREASPDAGERAFALGLRARIELSAGRQEASFPLFRESIRLHRQAGRVSDAADDSFALAFALNQRSHRYAEARAVLDDVHEWVGSHADGRAREAYYRGTLATETGDARAALRLLGEARERAARLGLTVLERNAVNAWALQLELLGRASEALTLLRKLEADASTSADASPCERVEIAINLGFGMLQANEHGAKAGDPTPELERALAIEGCKDVYLRTATLGNLALAALERDDPSAARSRLALARSSDGGVRGVERLFWSDLEGRIALAERNGRSALDAFDEEARLASSMLAFDAEWRAALGRGEALELLGRNDAALESYRHAEERLTTLSLLVPLGEGRGTFLGDRGRSARLAIDLLVRLHREGEAFAIARASRARVVAGLARSARMEGFGPADRARWEAALGAYRAARAAIDAEAKDDWKLPRGELAGARAGRERRETELRGALDHAFVLLGDSRPRDWSAFSPAPDELTLAFHPIRTGWIGLVAAANGVTSFTLPRLPNANDPAECSALLLSPLRARLDHARRLRVLAYGPLRTLDIHALPFDGVPLASRIAVEYPLDVPARVSSARDEGKPAALVIADPTLDLAGTRSENENVVKALRHAERWNVDVFEGPRATSGAILPLFAKAKLLHYAGHGVFAGREGWQSALPLASGGHLAMSDVLAMSSSPSRVVLSGCETGRTSHEAPAESLGLAQAFVIAGADFVIAPVRPVDDAVAARLSSALYGGLADPHDVDAASILRDAQLRVRTEVPDADWSAFRVVSR